MNVDWNHVWANNFGVYSIFSLKRLVGEKKRKVEEVNIGETIDIIKSQKSTKDCFSF